MEQIRRQLPRPLTPPCASKSSLRSALQAATLLVLVPWPLLTGCAVPTGMSGTASQSARPALRPPALRGKPVLPPKRTSLTIPAIAASSADAFVGSIGITVHFSYYGSIYTNDTPQMIAALQTLGIRHLRDAMCWQGATPENTYYLLHQLLGSLGFSTDYVMAYNQPLEEAIAYPGLVPDMEAVEGANEWDVSGDANWAADMTAQQAALFAAMQASAPGITVLAPSLAYPTDAPLLGNLSSMATAGNLHGYFGGYNPGGADINPAYYLNLMSQVTPSEPTWVTETGYFAQPGPIFGMNGVPESIQAVYSPRDLLEYWNAGADRTYLYELADDVEPGEDPTDYHWGLINADGTYKPAFFTLATLLAILKDPGPAFTPAPFPLEIQTSSPTVHTALFGKRDGSYYLAVWNEVQSYDFNANVILDAPLESVTLTVGEPLLYNGTTQFDAQGGVTTIAYAPTQSLTLPVSDKLQIVTWIPGSSLIQFGRR